MTTSTTARTTNCLEKLDRMNKTLRHEEADRVPISDFYWGSFLERWRQDLGLPAGTDIYKHYDLDWIVTTPNLDPHVKSFDILREDENEVVVRTGFEAVIRKKLADPMPAFLHFETDTMRRWRRSSSMTRGTSGAGSRPATTSWRASATALRAIPRRGSRP
jgi:uroporphyrinogen decarboxylase